MREVPKYRIIYTEMSTKLLEEIVFLTGQSMTANRLEKDACKDLVKRLNEHRELDATGDLRRTRTVAVLHRKVPFGFSCV